MNYFYSVLFFYISCFVLGQNIQLDKAGDFLKESERFVKKHKMDSAYFYAKSYYDTVKNSSNDTIIINSVIQLIKTTESLNEDEKYFQLAKEKAISFNNKTHLLDLYFTKGNNYYRSGVYSLALPYFLKVDSISKTNSIKNHTVVRSILKRAGISKLAFTYESSEIAYSLGKEALAEAEKINSDESMNLAYVVLADFCQLIGKHEEAKLYIDKGLKYYLNKDGYEGKVSRLYLLESANYLDQDSIKKGEQSRYKAILYLEDKNNDYEMAQAKYYYGHYLRYDKKDYITAVGFLEDSKELHQITDQVDSWSYHRCIRDLAICNDVLGNFEKSTKYYKEAYSLNIDLNKKANRNFSRNLETKYQSEKKEQEIALLKSENEVIDQRRKRQRNTLLGSLGTTIIAGLFLFVLYRNRQKTN